MKINFTKYEIRLHSEDHSHYDFLASSTRINEAKKMRFQYRSKFPNDKIELVEIQEVEKII